MIERTTNTDKVVACIWWSIVVSLMASSWVAMQLAGAWQIAILLAAASCATSGYAATRSIKCYAVRICELIRRTHDPHVEVPSVPLQRIH